MIITSIVYEYGIVQYGEDSRGLIDSGPESTSPLFGIDGLWRLHGDRASLGRISIYPHARFTSYIVEDSPTFFLVALPSPRITGATFAIAIESSPAAQWAHGTRHLSAESMCRCLPIRA